MKMVLNAKIQVANGLQTEFQKIMENNMDSFNQQMAVDMRKCVSKAWKEHGVRMPRERAIIDNLKYSEEWFTQSY